MPSHQHRRKARGRAQRDHGNAHRRPSHDLHPNFYRLEIAYSELPYYNAALTPALDVRNGFYHVSEAPGHGQELNPDYIAAGPNKSLID